MHPFQHQSLTIFFPPYTHLGSYPLHLKQYKDIELLIPKFEGDNGYQYYDAEQYYDYYAIAIFKQTGTTLAKIKDCLRHQNIPSILQILSEQQEALAKEKKRLSKCNLL